MEESKTALRTNLKSEPVDLSPGGVMEMLSFKTAQAWEAWLDRHHADTDGVWLRIFKKDSGRPTVTYAEALDGALCHGWIDGLRRSHDAVSYVQKFTPRRAKSVWSKINTEHIVRLRGLGKMKPAGEAAVEAAKKDGRWEAAYDGPSKSTIPEDFLRALAKNKKAKAFFATLNKTNLYAITWRLQTARKPETRARRMQAILEMLAAEKKFH